MEVFEAQHYRDYVAYCLKGPGRNRRGDVLRLAEKIKAHPTYVSQFLSGNAELSIDQGLGFCEFMTLDGEQTEFFLDLLSRDRAANKATKKHFAMRIARHLAKRRDLKNRLKLRDSLTLEQKAYYFRDWTPQAIHLLCQLAGKHTEDSIAHTLGIPLGKVSETVQQLLAFGLLEKHGAEIKSALAEVFIGKDDQFIEQLHINWRIKILTELQNKGSRSGFHFSTVLSIDKKTAEKIQASIIELLAQNKADILSAKEEQLYSYCMDFFGITNEER